MPVKYINDKNKKEPITMIHTRVKLRPILRAYNVRLKLHVTDLSVSKERHLSKRLYFFLNIECGFHKLLIPA